MRLADNRISSLITRDETNIFTVFTRSLARWSIMESYLTETVKISR